MMDGCCTSGCIIQFVGPEVPQKVHGSTSRISGTSVQLTFWKVIRPQNIMSSMAFHFCILKMFSFAQGEYGKLAQRVLLPNSHRPKQQLAHDVGGSGSRVGKDIPEALLSLPDCFVGFNMGLTVPDYEGWGHTLEALQR
jgi:hypothetical protein